MARCLGVYGDNQVLTWEKFVRQLTFMIRTRDKIRLDEIYPITLFVNFQHLINLISVHNESIKKIPRRSKGKVRLKIRKDQ